MPPKKAASRAQKRDADSDQESSQPAKRTRGATKATPVDDSQDVAPKTRGKGKVAVAKASTVHDSQDVKPKTKGKGKATVKKANAVDNSQFIVPETNEESKVAVKTELASNSTDTNIATSNDINIPVDESCPLTHYEVYIDEGRVIYDAALNQTNASHNNNKFYRLQLLCTAGDYKTWTRWGRVGDRGQSGVLGDGSLDDAIKNFDSKFKGKTGLSWDNRGATPRSGKYTFIERSYAPDSDDEKEKPSIVRVKDEEQEPESSLDPAVQGLMELIFNQQYFAATMNDLNYDVNKMPLGKLSKNTITRGYQALKDLSALMDDFTLAQTEYGTSFANATEQLSNSFYSLIPHNFGRNKPPVIRDPDMLKKELELLESLGDLKDTANLMKKGNDDVERINLLDRQFKGLNMDEMTPLGNNSSEFRELKNYLINTTGETHNANYKVDQIFRIARQNEKDRFEDRSQFAGPPRDRRLLWHGSRCTNYGGILSQGLRIAPPEAPVSGYMFGKGIYLADMSSKSANYCCPYISNGHALLLLCEAELLDPMQKLTDASYLADEEAKSKGMSSTWGQGTTGPSLWKDAECVHPSLKGTRMPDTSVKPGPTGVDNAFLLYNEYITYDIAQVRLRYLFRVRM